MNNLFQALPFFHFPLTRRPLLSSDPWGSTPFLADPPHFLPQAELQAIFFSFRDYMRSVFSAPLHYHIKNTGFRVLGYWRFESRKLSVNCGKKHYQRTGTWKFHVWKWAKGGYQKWGRWHEHLMSWAQWRDQPEGFQRRFPSGSEESYCKQHTGHGLHLYLNLGLHSREASSRL